MSFLRRQLPFISEPDRESAIVLLTVAVVMVTLWYFGRPRFFEASIAPLLPYGIGQGPLMSFFWFSGCMVTLRILVPWLVTRLFIGRPFREYGWGIGTFRGWWGYLLLLLLVIPLIWYASSLPSFLQRYPLGHRSFVDGSMGLWDFILYQFAYLMIFVSGESFWRGFVLLGLERRMGWLAILVMVIPYSMTHFGKPVAESYSSIVAGIALGWLALKHRSFWLGVGVHYIAALTMDLLAMHARGFSVLM